MDVLSKTDELLNFARANLSEERFFHSLNVAGTCAALCAKYNVSNAAIGFLAGICHDVCKEISDEQMIALARADGNSIDEIELKKPTLLHGRAAAVLLRNDFKIDDEALLEGVANHTFGKPQMCDFAKLLFVADKIEPSRPQVNAEYLQKLAPLSIDALTFAVARENFDFVKAKGKMSSPRTLLFLQWLEKNAQKGKK